MKKPIRPSTTFAAALALAALLAVPAFSQIQDAPAATPPAAAPAPVNNSAPAARLSPPVAEVAKLSSSGVGNDVVLAYVNGSHSMYLLTANDIVQLKDTGVAPTVITAMLNHDYAMRHPAPAMPQQNYVYDQRNYGQPQPADNQQVTQDLSAQAPQPQPTYATAAAPQYAPAPQIEYIPASPGPDYTWAPGYWGWNNGWCWIGGGWNLGIGYGWPGYRGYGYGYRGYGGYGYRGGGFHGSPGLHGGGSFHSGGSFHGSTGGHGFHH